MYLCEMRPITEGDLSRHVVVANGSQSSLSNEESLNIKRQRQRILTNLDLSAGTGKIALETIRNNQILHFSTTAENLSRHLQ